MRDLTPDQIGFAASSGPVEQYFPLAQRLGLRWLELACQNPVNFPQTFDGTRIRRVRRLAERSGIRCGLHSASFVNTAEIMPTVRRAAEAHLGEYVDLAVALGCEYLVIHCGFHFSVYLDRVRAALYETLARVTAYAERRRLPLAIENMNRLPGNSEFQYLGVTLDEFRALFRRIGSPYLALGLDVAHCELLPGGTVPFIRALPARIHSVQISDNRKTVDEHLAIGDGRVNFVRILRLLRRIDFAGPIIIELVDVPKKLRSRTRLLRMVQEANAGPGRRATRRASPARARRPAR